MAFLAFAGRMTLLGASPNSCLHQHIGKNHKEFLVLVYIWWGEKNISKLSSMFKSQ